MDLGVVGALSPSLARTKNPGLFELGQTVEGIEGLCSCLAGRWTGEGCSGWSVWGGTGGLSKDGEEAEEEDLHHGAWSGVQGGSGSHCQ